MDTELRILTNQVIANANALLSQRDGVLTEKQLKAVHIIIANAEKFLLLCIEFHEVDLEAITSTMRHELGNPLTPIRGYSDLLGTGMMGDLNSNQQDSVQIIFKSTDALRARVEEIVEEARQYAQSIQLQTA